jgi:hypothetical protein
MRIFISYLAELGVGLSPLGRSLGLLHSAETNMTHLVLYGMQNRIFIPYLAAINRIHSAGNTSDKSWQRLYGGNGQDFAERSKPMQSIPLATAP